MASEYLLKEYELCFEQLRFYDKRQETILKYMFSLTSAVATAQFAIYQLLHGTTAGFFGCEAFLSGLVFIATLLLFLAMLQNRLYFVYIARQLNAIRGYLMSAEGGGFTQNQLYTSTNFPALKPFSVHTFILVGAALISSLFAGAFAYAIPPAFGCRPYFGLGIGICLFIFTAEVLGGMMYLSAAGRKTADEAIHRQRPPRKKNGTSGTGPRVGDDDEA
jgi:hypothetical protein